MRPRERTGAIGCVCSFLAAALLVGVPTPSLAGPAPVAYWSFNDSGNPGHDDSGQGHDLTIPGTCSAVSGVSGKGIHFDSYGSGTNWGASPRGPYTATAGLGYPGPSGFAVEYWFQLGSASVQIGVRDYWQHVAGGETFVLRYDPATSLADFEVRSDFTNDNLPIEAAVSGLSGAWVHLLGSYDPVGYTTSLYVNDGLAAQGHLSGPMRSAIAPYFYISGSWHETNAGTVDEVKLYNQSVPEPATFLLVALGGLALRRCRRQRSA